MADRFKVRSYVVRRRGQVYRRWFVNNPEGVAVHTHAPRWEDALWIANHHATRRKVQEANRPLL